MVVSVPFLYWLMPTIVALAFGDEYRPASDAARLMLLAGAVGARLRVDEVAAGLGRAPGAADRHARDRDDRARSRSC